MASAVPPGSACAKSTREEEERNDERAEEREAAKEEAEEVCQKFEKGETLDTRA
jgi:uncharacterized coiled-coil DUF342 family protein